MKHDEWIKAAAKEAAQEFPRAFNGNLSNLTLLPETLGRIIAKHVPSLNRDLRDRLDMANAEVERLRRELTRARNRAKRPACAHPERKGVGWPPNAPESSGSHV